MQIFWGMNGLRQLNETELANAAFLTRFSIDFGLLEPTATGLGKSIMDATFEYRSFLSRQGIHDYSLQAQGTQNKSIIPARIMTLDGDVLEVAASLYRPMTKKGDPRVWFSQLKRHCIAGDILASVWNGSCIWLLNLSRVDLSKAVEINANYRTLLKPRISARESVFEELLEMLRDISARGFIPAIRHGDTGVGHLLETELGIQANSSKAPDYKGVEIKSTRGKQRRSLTLFARVPDWSISQLPSVRRLWEEFGYDRADGKGRRLNCTVSGTTWNSQGLKLSVDDNAGILREASRNPEVPYPVSWRLEVLQDALAQKHADTFWVKANSRREGGVELIHYHSAVQTSMPIVQQLSPMLASGGVTVDHVINLKAGAGVSAPREAGPLFKIKEQRFTELFPEPIIHSLMSKP